MCQPSTVNYYAVIEQCVIALCTCMTRFQAGQPSPPTAHAPPPAAGYPPPQGPPPGQQVPFTIIVTYTYMYVMGISLSPMGVYM